MAGEIEVRILRYLLLLFVALWEYSIMQLMIERSGGKLTKIKKLISTVIFL